MHSTSKKDMKQRKNLTMQEKHHVFFNERSGFYGGGKIEKRQSTDYQRFTVVEKSKKGILHLV